LPGFKPVSVKAAEQVAGNLKNSSVFFMDRLSRGALVLAQRAAANGAIVMFEPSARSDEKLLREAIEVAHIVKYTDQRFARIPGVMEPGSATLLEVQTLGEKGLRYRHRFGRSASAWKHSNAITAPQLTDTCGSGDWCTAGLLSMLAVDGQEGLMRAGASALASALRYGQTLAAWNCGFEGARGGMYMVERDQLDTHLAAIASGRFESAPPRTVRRRSPVSLACPACPPRC
jgi:fructokinase